MFPQIVLLIISCVTVSLSFGQIAYYPFSGNAGDSSGNNYHCTVNGALPTSDRFGNPNQAYQFDGINDYISVPNFGTFDSVSISVWVYIDSFTASPAIMGSYGWAAGNMHVIKECMK